jgi:hypothetical protein
MIYEKISAEPVRVRQQQGRMHLSCRRTSYFLTCYSVYKYSKKEGQPTAISAIPAAHCFDY